MDLTIVVGTGRCGSTLLSRILREHPDVLSVSEFFSTLGVGRKLPTGELDGAELWGLLSAPATFLDALIRDGLKPPELYYPYGKGRFDPATGVPVICHSVLPLLTDDPDGLFDRLAAEIPAWPRRPAADQYRHVFRLLAGLYGRRFVVERSGASLVMVERLRRLFPEARFVHLHRDGPDCALSMSRHPSFRWQTLAISAVRAAGLPPTATLEEVEAALPARFRGLICPPYNADLLMGYPIPVHVFGAQWWSAMVCDGVASLRELPREAWISMSYEALLRGPEAELRRLAEFAGLPVPARWLEAARRLVDPGRAGRARAELDAESLAALRAACEPGAAAIAAAEHSLS
ncbi:sulfotransferase [Nonomuraea composti]|uniref:sulfotransferase n=1 Tax=Nonomuraea composti TaxID=2720023 RepID=UPI0019816D84